jgi:hypothetical protein
MWNVPGIGKTDLGDNRDHHFEIKISKSQAFSNENRTHHRLTIPLDYGEIVALGVFRRLCGRVFGCDIDTYDTDVHIIQA